MQEETEAGTEEEIEEHQEVEVEEHLIKVLQLSLFHTEHTYIGLKIVLLLNALILLEYLNLIEESIYSRKQRLDLLIKFLVLLLRFTLVLSLLMESVLMDLRLVKYFI